MDFPSYVMMNYDITYYNTRSANTIEIPHHFKYMLVNGNRECEI